MVRRDEIGYSAISGKVEPFDIQATILNQAGFDHEKFTYQFQGRPLSGWRIRGGKRSRTYWREDREPQDY